MSNLAEFNRPLKHFGNEQTDVSEILESGILNHAKDCYIRFYEAGDGLYQHNTLALEFTFPGDNLVQMEAILIKKNLSSMTFLQLMDEMVANPSAAVAAAITRYIGHDITLSEHLRNGVLVGEEEKAIP